MSHADDLIFIQNRTLRAIYDREGAAAFDLAATELFISMAALISAVGGRRHLDSVMDTIQIAQDRGL